MSANSEEEPGDLGLNMRGFLHRWEGFLYVILDCIFLFSLWSQWLHTNLILPYWTCECVFR
jgi:hypothetical protein